MKRKIKAGKIPVDMHLHLGPEYQHSSFNSVIDGYCQRFGVSGDSVGAVINLADRGKGGYINLSEKRGYHREFFGENQGFYVPERGLMVLRGWEGITKQGELLVAGLPKKINPKQGRDLEETIREIKDSCNPAAIIAQHPMVLRGFGVGAHLKKHPEILKYYDAIEVFNGELFFIPFATPHEPNKQAEEFYNKVKDSYKIGMLACSDASRPPEAGKTFTWLGTPDLKDPIESLRRNIINSTDPENLVKETQLIWAGLHVVETGWNIAAEKLKNLRRKLGR